MSEKCVTVTASSEDVPGQPVCLRRSGCLPRKSASTYCPARVVIAVEIPARADLVPVVVESADRQISVMRDAESCPATGRVAEIDGYAASRKTRHRPMRTAPDIRCSPARMG